MVFNRTEAKLAARESMRSNRPSPLLVTLVYFLLMVVGSVVSRLTSSPLTETMQYLMMGYDISDIAEYMLASNQWGLVAFGVSGLLISIYQTIMAYGYTSYTLRLARNEQPGYARLFDGFARPIRVLGAAILTAVFVFLWTFIFSLPVVGGYILLLLAGALDYELVVGGYWLVLFAVVVLSEIVALRYRLNAYFLLDDPACTVWESLRRSRGAMKGRKLELFVLDLSFLLWMLLVVFTAGIAGVWVFPYQNATYANFYDAVTQADAPAGDGGYAGQIYDRDSDFGSKPF